MRNSSTPSPIQPKISIIVPVFNAEKYIYRCLDSLLSQTFTDYEIILIDDGSTDNSGNICDEYASKDKRIKVIHKENGGVASARQAGTDVACGEYIIHADPDDWVEPSMLEELLGKAEKTGADVTICDYYVSDDKGCRYICQEPPNLEADSVLSALFHRLHGSLWNKLVKRACYIKYNLRFIPRVNYCEDVLIWVQLLQHPEVKIAYLNKAFYYYYQGNTESITHSLTPQVIITRFKYIKALEALMPQKFNYLVERTKMMFDFVLWRNSLISDNELYSKKYKMKAISMCPYCLVDKLAYSVAVSNFPKVSRTILLIQRVWRKMKLDMLKFSAVL